MNTQNGLVGHSRGENWTNSLLVAENLGKKHIHVLEKIRKLLSNLDKLTNETSIVVSPENKKKVEYSEKFILEKYLAENGHEYERYKLNKPAFSLLLMQLSGNKVIPLQRAFNQAFYEMEQYIAKIENSQFIAAREQGKLARVEVSNAIKDLVDLATSQGSTHASYYYSTITKETYKALGFLAQGEKVGSDFRNHLDNFQLAELFIAESLATRTIEKAVEEGLHYKEIYLLAKQKVCEYGKSQQAFKLTDNLSTK